MCITSGLTAAFLVACGDLIGDSPIRQIKEKGLKRLRRCPKLRELGQEITANNRDKGKGKKEFTPKKAEKTEQAKRVHRKETPTWKILSGYPFFKKYFPGITTPEELKNLAREYDYDVRAMLKGKTMVGTAIGILYRFLKAQGLAVKPLPSSTANK